MRLRDSTVVVLNVQQMERMDSDGGLAKLHAMLRSCREEPLPSSASGTSSASLASANVQCDSGPWLIYYSRLPLRSANEIVASLSEQSGAPLPDVFITSAGTKMWVRRRRGISTAASISGSIPSSSSSAAAKKMLSEWISFQDFEARLGGYGQVGARECSVLQNKSLLL